MANDWLAQYEAKQAQQQKHAEENIRTACDLLTRLGVETVTVEYDGEGDSGSIENITFDPMPAAGIPVGLDETIMEAAYEFLPGGWEINDGSFGKLTIDVQTRKINREHNWRVTETEFSEESFDIND